MMTADKFLVMWQEQLRKDYESGKQIILESVPKHSKQHYRTLSADSIRRPHSVSATAEQGIRKVVGYLVRIKAIVVGLDFREYSRREPEVQLLLTVALEASIGKTIAALRRGSLLPPNEPRVVESTGDGAYLIFTLLDDYRPYHGCDPVTERNEKTPPQELAAWMEEKERIEDAGFTKLVDRALSFVFGLNAVLASDNSREAFRATEGCEEGSFVPAHPVECRFAVSYDDLLLRRRLTKPEALACSGTGIVTCSRILSRDHANHLLVHDALLRKLEGRGGLPSICRGAWEHRLHAALLDDTKVKTGSYRFADLFGFYTDAPLLHCLGWCHERPSQYHIGSHNLGSVEGG